MTDDSVPPLVIDTPHGPLTPVGTTPDERRAFDAIRNARLPVHEKNAYARLVASIAPGATRRAMPSGPLAIDAYQSHGEADAVIRKLVKRIAG